ncbi:MAG: hypothetical protein A2158_05720 [Chloroflexi bacterium RBG_13_46_14]|nr:MAG: hypothetical protein A2158_05720 [Chloroflexi bacterium RBG_13_46_14]
MKKYVMVSIIISIIIVGSIIVAGTYFLKRMELPPVIPFTIFAIIIFFVLLIINFIIIKKSNRN